MISLYTSHINSLMMAALWPKHVAAFIIAAVKLCIDSRHFLCILEAQWGYHTIQTWPCSYNWKGGELEVIWNGH